MGDDEELPEAGTAGAEEMDEAATKIQAGFKGTQARKEVEENKEKGDGEEKGEKERPDSTGKSKKAIEIQVRCPNAQTSKQICQRKLF